MRDLNKIVGGLMIVLGTTSLLISFAIALQQYVFRAAETVRGLSQGLIDLVKILLEFGKSLLEAPPALAFLAAGVILVVLGVWILTAKPIKAYVK